MGCREKYNKALVWDLGPEGPRPYSLNVIQLNEISGGTTDIVQGMFAKPKIDQQPVTSPNAQLLGPELAKIYGEQVAREFPLIESVLCKVAATLNIDLGEADFDTFCRSRQAKLNLHSQQGPEEHFERARLLNLLYEGCLRFLKDAANAQTSGDTVVAVEKCKRAEGIISHLVATLDHSQGGTIATELFRLYEFSLAHLTEARSEQSASKFLEVHGIIEKIYMGYLEVELQQDAEKMLKAKVLHNKRVDTTAQDGGVSR